MRKEVKLQAEDFVPAWASEYPEKKFTVFNTCFLSTKKNSHKLDIDEEVLKRDAKSILGNFLVAKLEYGDASTHLPDEIIYGYFPKEQEIIFEEEEENGVKIVKAEAYCVISKMYGKEFNEIFSYNNLRNTSVEMTVETAEDNENKVLSFDIYGLTCLGTTVNGSCPDANMKMVRFSEEEANKFFAKVHNNNSLTILKKFVEERKESMAENKTYKIDKSKDAMSDTPWGEINKSELRNKIMEAKNKSSLVKAVYMLVEDGWEEAPSEKLKYPVMEIKGDSVVYNKGGLASALGYAKKENETEVVNKVEAIYKKLGLGKEEDAKMAEIEFAAVDIGDMWDKLYYAVCRRSDWDYHICGIYEQDNKKFAIICDRAGEKYRLDFSYTEEGLTIADEIVKVQTEFIETDDVKKFAEPEDVEKYKKFEIEGRKAWAKVIKKVQDHEGDGAYVDSIEDNHIIYTKGDVRYRVEADIKVDKDDKSVDADIKWDTVKKDADQKMSCEKELSEMTPEEMAEKIGMLQKDIEDRDNIIMEKDTKMGEMEKELSELREFKKCQMEKDKACAVESVMSEVKDFMNEEKFKELRDEGMSCEFAQIDAWSNKVKAFCFENNKTNTKQKNGLLTFSAPVYTKQNKNGSVWDRL